MLKGKKGFSSFEKVWNTVLVIALLAFGIFAVLMPSIGEYYIMTDFSVNQLQNDILTSRFMTSSDCLAFTDGLDVTHAGVIDLDKISNAYNCIGPEQFILKLYDYDDFDGGNPLRNINSLNSDDMEEPQTYGFLVNYVESGCDLDCELHLSVLEVTVE
jgi:hypothetical protein